MPITTGKDLQGCWVRWGQAGKKYHYTCGDETARDAAKAKAHRQGAAIGEYTTAFATRKVGFDYDEILTKSRYRMIAERLINRGVLVYVVSARSSKTAMYSVTDDLSIPRNRVFAVGSNEAKIEKVKSLGLSAFYDNNPDVRQAIGVIAKY